jgi:rSAM/selenodomain-associated transferase 1
MNACRPRPRRQLVVMVKAPRLGAVKRRLAAAIGDRAALLFYRRSLRALLARLTRDARWRCLVYVTPDRELRRLRLGPGRYFLKPQGKGDLGRRMARPLTELPPGPVVIIGSDIPGIGRHHIAEAFRRLGTHDLVFGPAPDGGYWLVGARRRPHLPRLFRHVRWSSENALADSMAGLDRRHRIALLGELEDVDDAASYARYRARERRR